LVLIQAALALFYIGVFGVGAASEGARLEKSSFGHIQKAKADCSRPKEGREVIVECEVSEDEHFGPSVADVGILSRRDNDGFEIISERLVKSLVSRTASDHIERGLALALIEGDCGELGLNIYSCLSNDCGAFPCVLKVIEKQQFFVLGESTLDLEVFNRQKRTFAFDKSKQLNATGSRQNGSEDADYSGPSQHAPFKLSGLLFACASILGTLIGVWSIVFCDGLGRWWWIVSVLGWLLAYASMFVLFHDGKALLAIISKHLPV
jgi:hypothetical protein